MALLFCAVLLGTRVDEPVAPHVSDAPGGPSFVVQVVKPRTARPLFGLLPDGLFGLPPNTLQFDHASPGAEIGSVEHDRLELSADGWDLVIETDGEGRVGPGTRLVLPVELADKLLTLRCQPADPASGYLRTTTRAGSDELDGSFLVEFATCEKAETGKVIEWPPRPLTVRGYFSGLPQGSR